MNWTDRLKEKKYWSWLKPLSTTKLGALAGGTLAAVFDNLTKITEPILDRVEQYVRTLPKSQEGKDLAASLVRPLFYIGSTVVFAIVGFLNDIYKERTVRKFESTKVRKQENVDRLRVAIEGLTHKRIILQLCDIKLGEGQFADVKSYNRRFVDMYKDGKEKYAWESYYGEQAAENWQRTQDLLGKPDTGIFRGITSGVSKLLNGTVIWPDVWWADRLIDYASLKAGQAIGRMRSQKKDP